MKRFTDTEKWFDPWFRNLEPKFKLLWSYICDRCDLAGVWKPDLGLASFLLGENLDEATTLAALGDRIEVLPSGNWFLVKFIAFQYGELTESCNPHKAVLKCLRSHSINSDTLSQPLRKGCSTLTEGLPNPPGSGSGSRSGKGSGKDPEGKGCGEGGQNPDVVEALKFLNEKTGRDFRETEANFSVVGARLKEPGVTLDGVKAMIVRQCAMWKGGMMEEFLRPQTLFGKVKFDGYYAAKDLPPNLDGVKPTASQEIKEELHAPLL